MHGVSSDRDAGGGLLAPATSPPPHTEHYAYSGFIIIFLVFLNGQGFASARSEILHMAHILIMWAQIEVRPHRTNTKFRSEITVNE